jgi:hypothetical protein
LLPAEGSARNWGSKPIEKLRKLREWLRDAQNVCADSYKRTQPDLSALNNLHYRPAV